ncbi:MAG: M57 family metalloprotease [Agriterribacter sp.]
MKSTIPQLTLALSCFFSLFIFNSCKKADLSSSDLTENYKSILLAQGFDTTGIIDLGDYLIVEGDIGILKSSLRTSERQAAISSTAPISESNQTDITIFVNGTIPSTGTDNWRNELATAVGAYNNLTNSNIRFRIVTASPADIIIQSDNGTLNNNVLGRGSWPTSGKAGSSISINLDFDNDVTVTTSRKVWTLVHELGHNIGFRHTNWFGLGESNGIRVGNSPNGTNNPDPGSVMNGGNINNWAGFSSWDVYAIQTLYPRPQPFTVQIYGGVPDSEYLSPGQYITVSASASAAGSTYSWSVTGGSPSGSTTGSSFTAIVGNPYTFSIGVTATSPSGATAYDAELSWD